MSLTFRGDQDLLDYLVGNAQGRCILREAVSCSRQIIDEVLEYNRTTYVLVKCYRDGLVEVYGPKSCRARIVFLGRSVTFPEMEMAVEAEVSSKLASPYQEINYPGNKRAIGLRGSGIEKDRQTKVPYTGGLLCTKSGTEPESYSVSTTTSKRPCPGSGDGQQPITS